MASIAQMFAEMTERCAIGPKFTSKLPSGSRTSRPEEHPRGHVFVTDEADCSYNKSCAEIFEQDGNRVFWPDPASVFPTSAVCWNAGVECEGDPSNYDACNAVNKDVEGNSAVSDALDRGRGLEPGLLGGPSPSLAWGGRQARLRQVQTSNTSAR